MASSREAQVCLQGEGWGNHRSLGSSMRPRAAFHLAFQEGDRSFLGEEVKVDQEKVDQEKVDQEKVDQEKVDQEKEAQGHQEALAELGVH